MSYVAALAEGAVAMMAVSEVTVKLSAAVLPKDTAVAPVKPLPSIVTTVPPAIVPELGVMPVTDGVAAAVYTK
jgi:hypothetical protein